MSSLAGGCFCGAIRYCLDGKSGPVTHCHCLDCRRASGAPVITWIEFDDDRHRFTQGEPVWYRHEHAERGFCQRCGTLLTYRQLQSSGTTDFTVASLDEPEKVTPQDHVWTVRQLPWMEMKGDLRRFRRGRHDES